MAMDFIPMVDLKIKTLRDQMAQGMKPTPREKMYMSLMKRVPCLIKLALVPPPALAPPVEKTPAATPAGPKPAGPKPAEPKPAEPKPAAAPAPQNSTGAINPVGGFEVHHDMGP
jgi:hypothetical protein